MFIKNYSFNKSKSTYHGFRNRLRLFFERDVKVRQIASNIGSTFRNSKWTDYTLTNVSRLTLTVDLNPLFNLFILTTLVFSLILSSGSVDLYLYSDCFFFFLWFPLCLTDLFSLPTHIPFFFQGVLTLLPVFYSRVLISTLTGSEFSLINWIQAQTKKQLTMENETTFNTLTPLFQSGSALNLGFPQLAQVFTNQNSTVSSSILADKVMFDLLNCSKEGVQTPLLSTGVLWTFEGFYWDTQLHNCLTNKTRDSQLMGSIFTNFTNSFSQLFYLTTLNFQKANFLSSQNYLLDLTWILEDRGRSISNLRWAYRYNVLHRRSVHNSHKLTDAKKLLNAGFFGLNLTDSNVWFSDEYARSLNEGKRKRHLSPQQLIKSNWNALYRPSLGYNTLLTNSYTNNPSFHNSQDVYKRLSFYESSFHFFLHRTSLYNSLEANITSSVFKELRDPQNLLGLGTGHFRTLYLTATTNLYRKTTKPGQLNLVLTPSTKSLGSNSTNVGQKDSIIVKYDTNILNLRSLEVLLGSTQPSQLTNQQFYFFDYLGFQINRTSTTKFMWVNNSKLKNSLV